MEKLILKNANSTIEFSRPTQKGYVHVVIDDGSGPNEIIPADILLSNEQLTRLTMWLHEYGLEQQKKHG